MSDDKIVSPYSEDLINFVATERPGVREFTQHAENRPTESSQHKSLAMKSGELLRAQPKTAVFIECLLLALAIGYVDYITPWQWTMSVFYAPPILITVWYGPRKSSLLMAGCCAII